MYYKYELIPNDGRKSFYGKARVEVTDNCKRLISYQTVVLSVDINDILHRHWDCDRPSATTMRHINSFLREIEMPTMSMKDYMKLPYEPATV